MSIAPDFTETIPAFIAGQLLAKNEVPASLRGISIPMRRALAVCLDADRLDHFPRERAWRHPRGGARIDTLTIGALAARNLIVIIKRSGKLTRHARLTATGAWCARTIITETLQHAGEVYAARIKTPREHFTREER